MNGYVRRADRVRVNQRFAGSERAIGVFITNLSRSGAFIQTRRPEPVGSELRLEHELSTPWGEWLFEAEAEVVRVSSYPRGVGVRFTRLTKENRALIEQLLARQLH